MNLQWVGAGLRLLPFLVGAVQGVERLCVNAGGKAKQDAAIASLTAIVESAGITDDAVLLEDPDVERATRILINALVNFQNILARKAAPPAARQE